MKAEAAPKHAFTRWFGAPCNSVAANVCATTLFQNTDVVPRFVCTGSGDDCLGQVSQPIEREVLTTVRVAGGGGRSSVQINGKRCYGTCTLPIRRGAVVALRADSDGPRFRGWSGSCAGGSARCQLAAFRDARGNLPRVTATFG